MKTTLRRNLCWVGAALSLALSTSTTAQMMTAADMMNPDDLLYVIKVTPTLVYMDAGEAGGVEVGEMYMLLGEREGKDIFNQVAEVRGHSRRRGVFYCRNTLRRNWDRKWWCCNEPSRGTTGT